MPAGPRSSLRVAIVGASSLLGKELKQVLEDRNFPSEEVVLLDSSVMAGTLTEAGGEPTFVRALAEDSFDGARFVFFAGSAMDTEQNWEAAQRAGAAVIDLTGALAHGEHAASAWIPSLAKILPSQRGASGNGSLQRATYFSPPASVIIASTMAAGFGKLLPSRLMLLLFPPVSERGHLAVEELESQTASLLSFREIAKPLFDEQVAFNLITEYGAASAVSLADLGRIAAQDVACFLGGRVPAPAMQFVQAPVFHGYAFAVYGELAQGVPSSELLDAFTGLGVRFAAGDDPPPTNVSVAGESEIHLGRISSDANVPGGVWLWGAADNLRLAATNAVRIAEDLLGEV